MHGPEKILSSLSLWEPELNLKRTLKSFQKVRSALQMKPCMAAHSKHGYDCHSSAVSHMKRHQQNIPQGLASYLPLLFGMACCMLFWSGTILPAQQAFALQPSFSVYTASVAPASADHATIRSAEPGRANRFGDPWMDFPGANEDSLEEADFSDGPLLLGYISEDIEDSSTLAEILLRPYRSAPLYCLLEVFRI